MFMVWQSKGQEQVGSQCPGTGARTGRATPTLTDRASLSRSPPATAALLSPTTVPPPAGPLARPSPEHSSAKPFASPLYN